jgi:hypothetical protein
MIVKTELVEDEKDVHARNVAQSAKQSKSAGLSPC